MTELRWQTSEKLGAYLYVIRKSLCWFVDQKAQEQPFFCSLGNPKTIAIGQQDPTLICFKLGSAIWVFSPWNIPPSKPWIMNLSKYKSQIFSARGFGESFPLATVNIIQPLLFYHKATCFLGQLMKYIILTDGGWGIFWRGWLADEHTGWLIPSKIESLPVETATDKSRLSWSHEHTFPNL